MTQDRDERSPSTAETFASYASRAVAAASQISLTVIQITVRGYASEGDCLPHAYYRYGLSPPIYPGVTFVGSTSNYPYFQDAYGYYWSIAEDVIDPRYLGAKADYRNTSFFSIAAGASDQVSVSYSPGWNFADSDVGKLFGATMSGSPSPAWKYLRVVNQPASGDTIAISQALQTGQTGTGNGGCTRIYTGQTVALGNYTITFTSSTAFNVTDPSGSTIITGGKVGALTTSTEVNVLVQAGNIAFLAGDTISVAITGIHATFTTGTNNSTNVQLSSNMSTLANNLLAWIAATGTLAITASLTDTAYNEIQLKTTATGPTQNQWCIQYSGSQANIPLRWKYFWGGCGQGDLLTSITAVNIANNTATLAATTTVAQAGVNTGVNTSSFTGYIIGNLLYVTSVTSGIVTVGATVSGVSNETIIQQISGTSGGIGTYVVSFSQTVGSSGSPIAMTQTGWAQMSVGSDNWAAIQNSVYLTGVTSPASVINAFPAATAQYYQGNFRTKKIVFRSHSYDGAAFGVAQPIILPFGTDAEWQGEGELCALPGFSGSGDDAQPNFGGRYAVMMTPLGVPPYTGTAPSRLRLTNPRISCYFGWAQRCLWFPQALQNIKIIGQGNFMTDRRGVMLGYKNQQVNQNTIYSGLCEFTFYSTYQLTGKYDPESIGYHIDLGVTDCITGNIVCLGDIPNAYEDNGSANQADDIHPFPLSGLWAAAIMHSESKIRRVYADAMGVANNSILAFDPPPAYAVVMGALNPVYVENISWNASSLGEKYLIYQGCPQPLYVSRIFGSSAINGTSSGPYATPGTPYAFIRTPYNSALSSTPPFASFSSGGYAGTVWALQDAVQGSGSVTLSPGANWSATAGGGTITLPASCSIGQTCRITDASGSFASTAPVIKTSDGSTINGNSGSTGVNLNTGNARYDLEKISTTAWRLHVIT